jgi:predicted short-subunit dehydrogenase-like oxidoreductase (DUF2520 family)
MGCFLQPIFFFTRFAQFYFTSIPFFFYLRCMITAIVLGSGNVAIHFAKAIQSGEGVVLIQRYARSCANDIYFDTQIPKTNRLEDLIKADLYLIAVRDDAIAPVSAGIKTGGGLVVHTSGSIPVHALRCAAPRGVLYPVQTFSKQKTVNFSEVPLCLETERSGDMDLLKKFAYSLSSKVYELSSEQREKLHLAAVFANNFSNYMFKIADDICCNYRIPFEILKPLIQETSHKILGMSPYDAQTGPARRNDRKVIQKQRDLLEAGNKEIYTLLSEAIRNTYKKL